MPKMYVSAHASILIKLGHIQPCPHTIHMTEWWCATGEFYKHCIYHNYNPWNKTQKHVLSHMHPNMLKIHNNYNISYQCTCIYVHTFHYIHHCIHVKGTHWLDTEVFQLVKIILIHINACHIEEVITYQPIQHSLDIPYIYMTNRALLVRSAFSKAFIS